MNVVIYVGEGQQPPPRLLIEGKKESMLRAKRPGFLLLPFGIHNSLQGKDETKVSNGHPNRLGFPQDIWSQPHTES